MDSNQRLLRVGIIGSGIAGSFSASFARKTFGEEIEIIVFEKERQVGGRITHIHFHGRMIEAGASLIHSANEYLTQAIEQLNLSRTDSVKGEKSPTKHHKIGIWNGHGFDLLTSTSSFPLMTKLLTRYGLSLLKMKKVTREAVSRLSRIYEEQSRGKAYQSPEEMHKNLGLYEWAQEEAYSFFQRNRVGNRFVYEFSDGVARSNYVQGGEMNTWVTLVSLIGAGLDGGSLFSVVEGNQKICEGLLAQSGAKIYTETPIAKVALQTGENGGQVYQVISSTGHIENVDVVILATPIESANLEWEEIALPEEKWTNRKYQKNHVTFVAGHINPSYFSLKRMEDVPHMIMTQHKRDIPFSALASMGPASDGKQMIYKIFSTDKLSETVLSQLFNEYSDIEEIVWDAYPVLSPMKAWPPFYLGKGLYYVNSMESAVSTMETEAIAAKNVVNLLKEEYFR